MIIWGSLTRWSSWAAHSRNWWTTCFVTSSNCTETNSQISRRQIDLICQTGFYPHSYIWSFKKFNEESLPPRVSWKKARNDSEVEVSEQNYGHAQRVFTSFGCCNLGDYQDRSVDTDVLLLASVLEEFRAVCYNEYGLDCCYHFSASDLSGDAFLKVAKLILNFWLTT